LTGGFLFPHREARKHRVDLTQIDGIDAPTALTVGGEIGLDMTRWPTEIRFASWLGLAPGTSPEASRAAAAPNRRPAVRPPRSALPPVPSTAVTPPSAPFIAA